MTFLNPLDALIPKSGFHFLPNFGSRSRLGPEARLGRIFGGPLRGGGSGRGSRRGSCVPVTIRGVWASQRRRSKGNRAGTCRAGVVARGVRGGLVWACPEVGPSDVRRACGSDVKRAHCSQSPRVVAKRGPGSHWGARFVALQNVVATSASANCMYSGRRKSTFLE